MLVGWRIRESDLRLTRPMSALPAARTLIASSFSTAVATLKAPSGPADLLNRLNVAELEFCMAISLSSVTDSTQRRGKCL